MDVQTSHSKIKKIDNANTIRRLKLHDPRDNFNLFKSLNFPGTQTLNHNVLKLENK